VPKETANTTLRLPPDVKAVLNAHKNIRNIKFSELVNDILRGWCAAVTDWEHPYFSREVLGFGRIPGPPSRYPGYIATLGFVDRNFLGDPTTIDPSDSNPHRYHADHYRPAPETEEDELLVIDPTELDKLRGGEVGRAQD
jgi:hypothetical protein